MITNITISFQTDVPDQAPFSIDLNTPSSSYVLDVLHDELAASIALSPLPNASYDIRHSLAKFLKDFSNDLQLHREDECNANQEAREAISKYALDNTAEAMRKLSFDETVGWDGTPELPDDFKKILFEMDDVLLAVGTSWKERIEGLHQRIPMDDATKEKLLALVSYPEASMSLTVDA